MHVSGFRGHKKHQQQTQHNGHFLAQIWFQSKHLLMLSNYHYPGNLSRKAKEITQRVAHISRFVRDVGRTSMVQKRSKPDIRHANEFLLSLTFHAPSDSHITAAA
jgi:hypothetical protein